jgi:hypothetical protein
LSASAKKKPKKETWFARDDEVTKALRTHREYITGTKKAFAAAKDSLIASLECVPTDMKDEVINEAKLCKNRLYAVRLILGEPDPSSPIDDKLAGAKDEQTHSPTEDLLGDGDDNKSDKVSTVRRFVTASGDFSQAMRLYIASFADAGSNPALGHAPPCRSYRSLQCLSELDSHIPLIEAATSKDAITVTAVHLKPVKLAYTDLLAMCKSAAARLKTTWETAQKKKNEEKDTTSTQKRGRPKKDDLKVVTAPAVDNSVASTALVWELSQPPFLLSTNIT